MKKYRVIFAALLMILARSAFGIESEYVELIKCEKNYVDSSQISFSNKEILVEMEDVTLSVGAIYKDVDGFYFNCLAIHVNPLTSETLAWYDYFLPWQCPNGMCTQWNKGSRVVCKYCGTPRPSSKSSKTIN